MTAALLLIGRSLLLFASFAGLCAALRVRLGLHSCVAPFAAASCVIAALMLGGMLGLLLPTVCALYLLGLAGLAYAYLLKKSLPHPALYLGALLFIVFLIWRFYFCPLRRNDDISHWALVARLLLRYNRFPNGGDAIVYFGSYPLGTACFIYYVGRITANTEGIYLVAHNFLLGALFAPVFSLIHRRRRVLIPITGAVFFALFHFFRPMVTLQVDIVLAFFGIGTAAAITFYRRDPRRSLLAALPAMIAVAYVKNSGLFFAAASAAMLYETARRRGLRHPLRRALAAFAAPVAAYLLWTLHIRLRFPAALSSKHAVSPVAYLAQFQTKGLSVAGEIGKRLFLRLFTLDIDHLFAYGFILAAAALLFFAARPLAAAQRKRLRQIFCRALALYLVWYLLIYLMYIFSMPTEEALPLASLFRYNGTGLSYLMGLLTILLLDALQRTDALAPFLRWGSRVGALCVLAVLVITAGSLSHFKIFDRTLEPLPLRAALEQVRELYGLEDGCSILAYYENAAGDPVTVDTAYYAVKYEFETDDIVMIVSPGDGSTNFFISGHKEWLPLEDPAASVAENIDSRDIFLILRESPEFEAETAAFLDSYAGDTPVWRAYAADGGR